MGFSQVSRWQCTNPDCFHSWHYSQLCPYAGLPPRPMTQAQRNAYLYYGAAIRTGQFDLNKTPDYMLKRRAAAPPTVAGGYRWLLVFGPIAALWLLVMAGFMFYH